MSNNMEIINWNNVNYIEEEQKLFFNSQTLSVIPSTIINLYHNRVSYADLSFNQLDCLNGLSACPNISELIVDNNKINDRTEFPKNIINLKLLSLNNNEIENLDLLLMKLAVSCPNLQYLSLVNNIFYNRIVTDADLYHNYRKKVVNTLPNLKFLDFSAVTKAERNQSATSRQRNTLLVSVQQFFNSDYFIFNDHTPLPSTIRNPGDHMGTYAKRKYKYLGSQSEGNRFISNKDL